MIVIGVETCSFSRILGAQYTYEEYVIAVTVTVSLVVVVLIVTVTVIIF